jgi:hypothetical protein
MSLKTHLGLALSLALLAPGCGDAIGGELTADSGGGGSLGAGQGGAQDFGQFKQILEGAGSPAPRPSTTSASSTSTRSSSPTRPAPATCACTACTARWAT